MGPTKLAALLITIKTNPIRTKLRRGQMMVLNALRILIFLLGIEKIQFKTMQVTSKIWGFIFEFFGGIFLRFTQAEKTLPYV